MKPIEFLYDIDDDVDDCFVYDLEIYKLTEQLLEQILAFEWNLEQEKDKKKQIIMVKAYLKSLHRYKRKLMKKIKGMNYIREKYIKI